MKIKIMSYNTQHCLNYKTQKIDFDIIADTIKKYGADIIGLQEMRGKGTDPEYEEQTKILAEKLGFEYYYFGQAIAVKGENPYGNAIISRFPIEEVDKIMIPDPVEKKYKINYETRCIIKAKINVANGFTLLSTHFGLNLDEQENAVNTIVPNLESNNCALMGDFNVEPDNAVLNPIREKMFDTAELFDKPKFSYPSDEPNQKIDYIFTTRDVSVVCADIPDVVSSDHRPHLATIEL